MSSFCAALLSGAVSRIRGGAVARIRRATLNWDLPFSVLLLRYGNGYLENAVIELGVRQVNIGSIGQRNDAGEVSVLNLSANYVIPVLLPDFDIRRPYGPVDFPSHSSHRS